MPKLDQNKLQEQMRNILCSKHLFFLLLLSLMLPSEWRAMSIFFLSVRKSQLFVQTVLFEGRSTLSSLFYSQYQLQKQTYGRVPSMCFGAKKVARQEIRQQNTGVCESCIYVVLCGSSSLCYLTLILQCESSLSQYEINRCACVPKQFYRHKQVESQIWSLGYGFITFDLTPTADLQVQSVQKQETSSQEVQDKKCQHQD